MNQDRLVSKAHVEWARQYAALGRDQVQKDWEENRRSFERFYNNLALFSGGTIAASVTYLGYLKSASSQITHKWLLVSSWCSLLGCLVSSLFYALFYTNYIHYARDRELAGIDVLRFETEQKGSPSLNNPSLGTEQERTGRVEMLTKAILTRREDASVSGRKEKFYAFVWVWDSRLARLAFVVGLALLLTFAIYNS